MWYNTYNNGIISSLASNLNKGKVTKVIIFSLTMLSPNLIKLLQKIKSPKAEAKNFKQIRQICLKNILKQIWWIFWNRSSLSFVQMFFSRNFFSKISQLSLIFYQWLWNLCKTTNLHKYLKLFQCLWTFKETEKRKITQ